MPPTVANARKHIESFRARRGIPEHGAIDLENLNISDLNHALALTSTQLYADRFHFIWEIIQNNDDAAYDVEKPQLCIMLNKDTIYAWSNQTGFSEADVDSICGIGRSSKKGRADTIGEKGIGFKSLFTVADKVTIHSGPYQFKFDTSGPLGNIGMIVPTWVDEPAGMACEEFNIPRGGTTLTLRLKPQMAFELGILNKNLSELDFSFLIFCRRLTQISVSSAGIPYPFSKTALLEDIGQSTKILRVNRAQAVPQAYKFRLFSVDLADMPRQIERPDQTTSTIRLAFPLPDNPRTELMDEKTYAFLPMARFGFKFMIHANFILTANRGEVLRYHEWNKRLRSGLISLIVSAITWFATSAHAPSNVLWLQFVQSLFAVRDPFFRPLAEGVIRDLKTAPLLKTERTDSTFYQTTSRAFWVPPEFRTKEGGLIVDDTISRERSIEQRYTTGLAAQQTLETLGVRRFAIHDFVQQFERMVSNEALIFRSKDSSWHSAVAAVLLAARTTGSFQKCRQLAIIPLNSGEWVAASTANLVLSGGETRNIPSSLAMKVVDPQACQDRSRRLLFEELGVRECTVAQVCNAILADGGNMMRKSEQDVLAEISFLFASNYLPKQTDSYNFLIQRGTSRHAESEFHIGFGKIGSRVHEQISSSAGIITWLSSKYANIPSSDRLELFIDWLQKWPRVRLWPQVCRNHKLTSVMVSLGTSNGTLAILEHLLFRLQQGESLPIGDEAWIHCVGQLMCATDQGLRRLNETALPSVARYGQGLVPSLKLSKSEDPNWSFLSTFGVLTAVDARFLLCQLRNLKVANDDVTTGKIAPKIYFKLGRETADAASIQKAFATEALVYVGDSEWIRSSSCRWSAKVDCTVSYLLSKVYDQCSTLFRTILGVGNADVDDLLRELQKRSDNTGVGEIDIETAESSYRLLIELNKFLQSKVATAMQVARMKTLYMFPVLNVTSRSRNISIRVKRVQDRFWIGDIPSLQRKFSGSAPLLLPIDGVFTTDLNVLFKALNMDDKRLTQCVVSESISISSSEAFDPELTRFFLPKIPYITSLLQSVDEVKDTRKKFVTQLQNLQIYRVTGIKLRPYIQDGLVRIHGMEEVGQICLKPEAEKMVIQIDPELPDLDTYGLLAGHLGKFWGLQDKHQQLLSKVITSTSPRWFIEAFERVGIAIPVFPGAENQWIASQQQFPHNREISKTDDTAIGAADTSIRVYSGVQQPPLMNKGNTLRNASNVIREATRPTNEFLHPVLFISDDDAITSDLDTVKRVTESVIKVVAINDTAHQYQTRVGKNVHGLQSHNDMRQPIDLTTEGELNQHQHHQQAARNSDGTHAYHDQIESGAVPPQRQNVREARTDAPVGRETSQHSVPRNVIPSQHHSGSTEAQPSQFKKRKYDAGPAPNVQREEINQEIGRAGEKLVYDFLRTTLQPQFSYTSWTSCNRQVFFPSTPFTGNEWQYSDFTYEDKLGKLGQFLARSVPGYLIPQGPPSGVRYHLEVKTSMGGISSAAILSNNQIQMARRFSKICHSENDIRHDVFVLVRIYDLATMDPPEPKICFYPDAWDMICSGRLMIEGENGFRVSVPFAS